MAKEVMTVRIERETKHAMDTIAAVLDRDRSYVVKEALAAYVETHQWQIEHIQRGLREANAGKFVPERTMKRAIERLRRK
jgi:RHH-type rel operon transcriptional repressor/antitoxin RelB